MPISSFFKNADIAKKLEESELSSGYTQGPPYILPNLKIDGMENNPFHEIIQHLVGNSDQIMEGFVDLDKEWLEQSKDKVVSWSFWNMFDDIDEATIMEQINEWREAYPSPYIGRKAYFAQFNIVKKEVVTKNKEGKDIKLKDPKTGQQLYQWRPYGYGAHGFKEGSFKARPKICVFHNKELGWSDAPKKVKKTMMDQETGKMIEVEVEEKQEKKGFDYESVGIAFSIELKDKLINKVTEIGKSNDQHPEKAVEFLPVILLTYKLDISDRFGKDDPKKEKPPIGKWYNMNVDDMYFID